MTGVLHTGRITIIKVMVSMILNKHGEFYAQEWEVMGSIPVGDSDLFFVPRSCHVDPFTLHIQYS